MFFKIKSGSTIIVAFLISYIMTYWPCAGDALDSRFIKVTTNENLEAIETHHNLSLAIQCARLCTEQREEGSDILCDAIHFSDGKCVLYTVLDESVFNPGIQVNRYSGPSIVEQLFHTVYVRGQAFSIYRSTESMTYFGARAYCIYLGGHLLVIDSLDEYEAIDMIDGGQVGEMKEYWVGANDLDTEGVWLSERYNTPLDDGLWLWKDGQPNDSYGREDCAVIRFVDSWVLLDYWCYYSTYFLCEKMP